MIFDLDFVNMELEAAKTGRIPPALPDHPVFQAISFHESQLERPPLDEALFQARMEAAAAGAAHSWGLGPLFRDRVRLEHLIQWLHRDSKAITREIQARLARYTSAQTPADLRCVLYVGTGDGGFQIGNEHTVYLNLSVFTCREALLQTLTHESFHARAISRQARHRIHRLEEEDDYIGAVLYYTFEEGTADFIGNNGRLTSPYTILPLRTPSEGTQELWWLLWRWNHGLCTREDVYTAFQHSDCRYTAGVWIAQCIWEAYGKAGLDLWAAHCDSQEFYMAFLSTVQGTEWPRFYTNIRKK